MWVCFSNFTFIFVLKRVESLFKNKSAAPINFTKGPSKHGPRCYLQLPGTSSQRAPAPALPCSTGTAASAAGGGGTDTAEERAEEEQWALSRLVQPQGKGPGCASEADAATASHPRPRRMGECSLRALPPDHNPPFSPFYRQVLFSVLKGNAEGGRSHDLHLVLSINSVTVSGKFTGSVSL